MEEDIVFLEKMIKEYKTFGDLDNPDYEDTDRIYQAIENLINRNKELEEKQKSYDIAYKQGKAFENHRWKSLVRDILKKYAHTTIDDEENIINFYNEVKELLGDDK